MIKYLLVCFYSLIVGFAVGFRIKKDIEQLRLPDSLIFQLRLVNDMSVFGGQKRCSVYFDHGSITHFFVVDMGKNQEATECWNIELDHDGNLIHSGCDVDDWIIGGPI